MEKRKSENQLTKDSLPTEDGEEVTHGFEKASEDVLKTRKICKVKRGVAGGNTPATANPFAGIALKASQQQPVKDDEVKGDFSTKTTLGGGFGGLAKGGGGFGGLAFGAGGNGIAKEQGLAFGKASGEDSTAAQEEKPQSAVLPVFGSAKSPQEEVGEEEPVTTGEEEEDTLFSCMASLYEFESGQWKEKGKGTLKLNKHKNKETIRFIMRQQGNLKLLLNAHVWNGMKITKMEESKGISFSCVNHRTENSPETLSMFAVRTRDVGAIQGLCEAIDAHRAKQNKESC